MTARVLDFAAHRAKRASKTPELRVVSADELHLLFQGFRITPPRADGEGGPPPSAA